jgi:putative endonuclease
MQAKDALGRRGEELAAEYLEHEGFRILERNYRCSQGEIDIVAADHRTLVACEVKTRSGVGFGAPAEAVTKQKLHRLRRLTVQWAREHHLTFDGLRVDIVGVLRSGSDEFSIEHLRGVG